MIKYLIIWFITKTFSVPCEPVIIRDEIYGNEISRVQTSQACFKTETRKMEREFFNEDSAKSFYERVKQEIDKTPKIIKEINLPGRRVDSIKYTKFDSTAGVMGWNKLEFKSYKK